MGYQIIWADRSVEWIYHETVTGQEIIKSNEEIYGDPRFDDLRYQLVDMTQVEQFEVSEREIRQMAFFDAAAARSNPRIRLALIATSECGRAISEAYKASMKHPTWECEIFSTRETAENWLFAR